ncbi:hypothetical protein H6F49_23405 [Nodosilinea sp. FACHB-13]|nr:hypothetical protein [Nodosilinea sp. FACHB-13]
MGTYPPTHPPAYPSTHPHPATKLFMLSKDNLGHNLQGDVMELQMIRDRIATIRSKREALIQLLEQPDLGTLRIDVNQAIEEMDDLLEEFDRTFPVG